MCRFCKHRSQTGLKNKVQQIINIQKMLELFIAASALCETKANADLL